MHIYSKCCHPSPSDAFSVNQQRGFGRTKIAHSNNAEVWVQSRKGEIKSHGHEQLKKGSSATDSEIQRASKQWAQLLLVCTFQSERRSRQQCGGSYPPSALRFPFKRGPQICATKNNSMCLHLFSVMLSDVSGCCSCIFLSVLPSSLLSLSLTPAPIRAGDISANEIQASSVGTCFHLWWGYREREGEKESKGRKGEVEERGRGEALGASDSTITPSSGTISTWLLWACLQSKERWITCTSVNEAFCILLDCVLYCQRSLAKGRLSKSSNLFILSKLQSKGGTASKHRS